MDLKYTNNGKLYIHKLEEGTAPDNGNPALYFNDGTKTYHALLNNDIAVDADQQYNIKVCGQLYKLQKWWNPKLTIECIGSLTWNSSRCERSLFYLRGRLACRCYNGCYDESAYYRLCYQMQGCYWDWVTKLESSYKVCDGGGKPGLGNIYSLTLRETPEGDDPTSPENQKLYCDLNHLEYTLTNCGTDTFDDSSSYLPDITVPSNSLYSCENTCNCIVPLYEARFYNYQKTVCGTIRYCTTYLGKTYGLDYTTYYGYTSEG